MLGNFSFFYCRGSFLFVFKSTRLFVIEKNDTHHYDGLNTIFYTDSRNEKTLSSSQEADYQKKVTARQGRKN